jgi:hypothetical protein
MHFSALFAMFSTAGAVVIAENAYIMEYERKEERK